MVITEQGMNSEAEWKVVHTDKHNVEVFIGMITTFKTKKTITRSFMSNQSARNWARHGADVISTHLSKMKIPPPDEYFEVEI
jgi:hypothetical protein